MITICTLLVLGFELYGVSNAWEFLTNNSDVLDPDCMCDYITYRMFADLRIFALQWNSDIDFFPPSIVFQKVSVIKFYQMSLLNLNTCVCGKSNCAQDESILKMFGLHYNRA